MRTTWRRATAATAVAVMAGTAALSAPARADDRDGKVWVEPGSTYTLEGSGCVRGTGTDSRVIVVTRIEDVNRAIDGGARGDIQDDGTWEVTIKLPQPHPDYDYPDYFVMVPICNWATPDSQVITTVHVRQPEPPVTTTAVTTPPEPGPGLPAPSTTTKPTTTTTTSPGTTVGPVAVTATPRYTG